MAMMFYSYGEYVLSSPVISTPALLGVEAKQALYLMFDSRGHWNWERWSDLPRVTALISHGSGTASSWFSGERDPWPLEICPGSCWEKSPGLQKQKLSSLSQIFLLPKILRETGLSLLPLCFNLWPILQCRYLQTKPLWKTRASPNVAVFHNIWWGNKG